MRVLVLVEACGGVARHVADLCTGLHRLGIDVHLLYSTKRADGMLHAGLRRMADLGIPACAIEMGPAPHCRDIAALAKIHSYLRKHGPFDVLHGHSSKAGALSRVLPKCDQQIRVYTPHAFVTMNPRLNPLKRRFYAAIERRLARYGDAVIAVSTAEYAHALEVLKIPAGKLSLVPNGIEPAAQKTGVYRQSLRERWGVAPDEVVVGTIARLVPQKAPEYLLRAFAASSPAESRSRLVMVGDGPLRGELEKEAADLGIVERVVWPGYVEGPRAMEAFDLFALSSRYEGFPYVLLEALAAGLPVVTTVIGGADVTVIAGENGFVVPVADVPAMAGALTHLIADPTERRRMGSASLVRSELFSAARMVDETVAVYRKQLAALSR